MRWSTVLRVALLWTALGLSLFMVYRLISNANSGNDNTTHIQRRYHRQQNSPTISSENDNLNRVITTEEHTSLGAVSVDSNSVNLDKLEITGIQQSKFAYVTLLHGIDTSLSYRGFLYNCILMKRALHRLGSTADFLVLVGFTYGSHPKSQTIIEDLNLLSDHGLRLVFLPRLFPPNLLKWEKKGSKIQFHEMALLKVLPWSFTQYDRIQYMDGDVIPFKNMDCLFQLLRNTFNTGSASPLNSGWYLAMPNLDDYTALKRLAQWRLAAPRWDDVKGWGTPIPPTLKYRGLDRVVKKWDFNGASLDQGLCTHHFVLHNGRVQLLDTKVSMIYDGNYTYVTSPVEESLQACDGVKPVDMFYHFTGRNKPWLQDLANPRDKAIKYWIEEFQNAHFNISIEQLSQQKMKSPLGYFYPNK